MVKNYLALARVSSREQEREGFSLEVQELALCRYAEQSGGRIEKFFRIAETATRPEERDIFKELLDYARRHANRLEGLLFYKVDRAARNLFDYVELERLEADHGVKVIYVSQPTENTPAGRMMRRTLANMASFYTEQQSLDVRDGLSRRVEAGLFVGKAPYGYRNVRRDGRSLVETEPREAKNVAKIYQLYAYEPLTIDSLEERLPREGLHYRDDLRRFPRSKLYTILTDRSYLGEIPYKEQWYPGVHEVLVDRPTWNRVQEKMGGRICQAHELLYGSELVKCGECGRFVTGERKTKPTKKGAKSYTYYRCVKYNRPGHSRTRVNEEQFNNAVLGLFRRMAIKDPSMRSWLAEVIRAKSQESLTESSSKSEDLQRQLTLLRLQQDRLLNLRLNDEVDQDSFAAKQLELRDRMAALAVQVESAGEGRAQTKDLAAKVFELSQTLEQQWFSADVARKRQLLKIVCLNFSLSDVSLIPTIRKPFDALAEGLFVSLSRGDKS